MRSKKRSASVIVASILVLVAIVVMWLPNPLVDTEIPGVKGEAYFRKALSKFRLIEGDYPTDLRDEKFLEKYLHLTGIAKILKVPGYPNLYVVKNVRKSSWYLVKYVYRGRDKFPEVAFLFMAM